MKLNFRALSLAISSLLIGIAALVVCDLTQVSWNSHQVLNNLMNDLHFGIIPLVLLGCTRIIYSPKEGEFITVRSMDWRDYDMSLSVWVSPRSTDANKITRKGADGSMKGNQKALEWEPKYGSIVICNYEVATTDGMNDQGLVANALFLPSADYGPKDKLDKPYLAISGLAQYVLDTYESVEKAVVGLKEEKFRVFTDKIAVYRGYPQRTALDITLYLVLSDKSGDSAIFQYIQGEGGDYELKVYHKPEDKVLTNSYKVATNSLYDGQLKILENFGKKAEEEINWDSQEFSWDDVINPDDHKKPPVKDLNPQMNGTQMRFIRASFYSDRTEQTTEPKVRYPRSELTNIDAGSWTEKWTYEEKIARAFSLIRNLSTPLSVKGGENPFLSSTLWRTVADQTNKRYFFESARSIYPLYFDLPELLENLKTFLKLDLYLPAEYEDDPNEISLQKDQMKEKPEKVGKIEKETFTEVALTDWFSFDPF
ncbi:linear amide C-N hydrolase [Scytonema hofmannii FACHB-248]|uniref:Linear amide C-N hydrolase n=1 Tax=Scytonema hofmannii FACHB-248 TaxID=1842502 RepID=A0ABR8GY95_9CYAN|nr:MULTISPECIES: linear amide C-N hydrolase [Nostocales]MBD2607738.1 linear amide C-N hydrolase [Scytonema hofmannii FACHB-248]